MEVAILKTLATMYKKRQNLIQAECIRAVLFSRNCIFLNCSTHSIALNGYKTAILKTLGVCNLYPQILLFLFLQVLHA